MFTREKRAKILESYENKEEKILISNILDKAFRFDKENKVIYTNFLNLHELDLANRVLNELKVPFYIYAPNEYCNKKVIFFIPDYVEDNSKIYDDAISCLKIIPNVKNKLIHKDYMGGIYSLGIKNEMIGDIFAYDEYAYVFCMKSVTNYLITNLYKIGNQEVKLEEMNLNDKEFLNISVNLVKKEYIIPSLRVDAILSEVYNLSRMQTKEKILKGDLFLNDKNMFYPHINLKENDIVSFRKCGKIKIGKVLRKTKNDNFVTEIYKFS